MSDVQKHPRIRMLVTPANVANGTPMVLLLSGLDETQLAEGRKPCGKMGLRVEQPGYLFVTPANGQKLIDEGCSWQRDLLTSQEVEQQNTQLRKGLGLE